MKELIIYKSLGYKNLSDSECGRKKQTHIGLTDGFFYFIKDMSGYEVFQNNCKFYFKNSITDSSCHINAIKDAVSGEFRNPKLTSGKLIKDTVFKLIKEIASANQIDYYLVWDYSTFLGSFLLIEKDGVNYDLIKQLDDNSISEEIKEKLIKNRFDNLNFNSNDFEISSILDDENMTVFFMKLVKYLNENNIIERLFTHLDISSKQTNYKGNRTHIFLNSLKTPLFLAYNQKYQKLSLTEKELNSFKKNFDCSNEFIFGKKYLYLSNQWTFEDNTKSSHPSAKIFIEIFNKVYNNDFEIIYNEQSPGRNHYFFKRKKETFNQKIFYGSPGTGKSRLIKQEYGNGWPRITFHPELDYQGFVGTYKPSMKSISDIDPKEEITYEYVPEAFIKAYCKAWKSNKPYYLIIEEINRGNCAQIFGDIFQLLDRDNKGYSEYPIECSPDIQRFLRKEFENDFDRKAEYEEVSCSTDFSRMALPNNLSILATMNTSDQSLFPMDSAFKRRWDWQYVPIDYDDARTNLTINVGEGYNWGDFILSVNKQVKEHTQSEDKQLGNRFVSPRDGIITPEQFVSKVLFYLWTEIYKDEQGTGNTIFINSEDDSEILFGDFFEFDGKINESILMSFLNHILPKEQTRTVTEQEADITGDQSDN